jgi:hypothetical protein
MKRRFNITEEVTIKFAQWVTNTFAPISVIYACDQVQTAIHEFEHLGLRVGLPLDALKSQQKWDALIISESEFGEVVDSVPVDFHKLLEIVDRIIFLYSYESERSMPLSAIKTLFKRGYTREFLAAEGLCDDICVMVFHRESEDSALSVEV